MEDDYGVIFNDVMFVVVLFVCVYVGFVEEGCFVYKRMSKMYGLVLRVEYYVCMVDMFGRVGLFDEVYSFIYEFDVVGKVIFLVLWIAMFGVCKMYRNYDFGVDIVKRFIVFELENLGYYVMFLNIYVLSGKIDEVLYVRDGMIKNNFRK